MIRSFCVRCFLSLAFVLVAQQAAHAQFAGESSPSAPDNPIDRSAAAPAQDRPFSAKDPNTKYRLERAPLPEDQAERDAERAKGADARKRAQAAAQTERKAHKGVFQSGSLSSWPRLYQSESLSVKGSFNAGIAPYAMSNNVFDAPPGSLNAGVPVHPGWGEAYVQPGISVKYHVDAEAYLYGGFSFVETGTIGNDYTGAPYRWYGLPEQLYAGFHAAHVFGSNATLDGSYGQQDYTNGNGMLVWSGATNGAGRGATYLGPRTAWRDAGLLRATEGDFSGQLFYLRPNESEASFTNTSLTGINAVWNPPGRLRLGAQYVYTLSDIVPRTRMSTWELRARLHPFKGDVNFWLQGDYALQGKPSVSADGWTLQGNYAFTKLWWRPLVNAGYYSMSASNPANPQGWNGFDPLYFGNAVPTWLPGIALQTSLANTNQNVFNTTVTLKPNAKGTLQLNYIAAAVNRENAILKTLSPGETPPVSGGLLLPGYGTEVSASYTYKLDDARSVDPIFAYVIPGNGIEQNYAAAGGSAKGWSFFGVAFKASY